MKPLTDIEREWLELNGYKQNGPLWYITGNTIEPFNLEKILPSRNAEAFERELLWLWGLNENRWFNMGWNRNQWFVEREDKIYESTFTYSGNHRLAILEAGVLARRGLRKMEETP